MSDTDIEKGARWENEISLRLAESDLGIICLTPDNLEEPWVLFEAGALAKKLKRRARVHLSLPSEAARCKTASFNVPAHKG